MESLILFRLHVWVVQGTFLLVPQRLQVSPCQAEIQGRASILGGNSCMSPVLGTHQCLGRVDRCMHEQKRFSQPPSGRGRGGNGRRKLPPHHPGMSW